jgi:ATP-dependent DNA helicase RecQ
MPAEKRPEDVLRDVFGYESFRGEQRAVIDCCLAGNDALVLMPTGGGKSLCFQIPALIRSGTALVISPLIALMRDQVEMLRQSGVRAAYLNSSLDRDEERMVENQLAAGELDLLYVAPERVLMPRMQSSLEGVEISLIAIDEAHCVSQWGHDFRPEYLQLAALGQRYPGVPRLALTATADEPTRREIVDRLELDGARRFISSFDRPNIFYRVVPKASPRDQLLRFIRDGRSGEAGIVYCLSRRKVDETAKWLSLQGVKALPYHARLDSQVRALHQDRFLREDGLVMVATVAFGMGIDKPDVRFVAHMDLPKSLEAYYQETGRAGRDGLPSTAWMAYGLQDVVAMRRMVDESTSGDDRKRVEHRKLEALLGYCELTSCRRQSLLGYFGESLASPCGHCDTCVEPVDSFDGTEEAQKVLSCVYRTGQRFGVGYVVDVLTGKSDERIARNQHDQLSTFGLGKDRDAPAWRSVVRQLVAKGLLSVDVDGYGSLRLTEACRPVLRGDDRVSLRRDPAPKSRSARAAPRERLPLEIEDELLFDKLRERRRELAKEQGVPPYVIFHDATLVEMATVRPGTLVSLADVGGVGAKKLERYGDAFLTVISEHAERGDRAGA